MLLRIACSLAGRAKALRFAEGKESWIFGGTQTRACEIGREGVLRRHGRTAVLVGAVSVRLACSSSSDGKLPFEAGFATPLALRAATVDWLPSNEKTMNQPTTTARTDRRTPSKTRRIRPGAGNINTPSSWFGGWMDDHQDAGSSTAQAAQNLAIASQNTYAAA